MDMVYWYTQGGIDVNVRFSYQIKEDSCLLLEKMSTSFEKVYLLTVKGEFYANVMFVENGTVVRSNEAIKIGNLNVSYVHNIARELFE